MKYIIFMAIFFITLHPGISKDKQIVLISGLVKNVEDGSVISTKVKFINSEGVVFEAKSNSADGSYQQVLPVGEQYSIIIEGYLLTDHAVLLNLQNLTKYYEMTRNFDVIKLTEGFELLKIDAFVDNDSKIHDSLNTYINFLKHILTHQKGLHIDLVINTGDSYFKNKKVKQTVIEKKKKKTKTVTVKNKEQLSELLDLRAEVLRDLIKNNKIQERNASVSTDLIETTAPKVVKKKKKSKTPPPPKEPVFDLTVKISKVMKL
ncbi:MAG: hypothetical protein M9949_11665 [Candidatus Kapabacteria bacterium]|nr:hypothetical protein [Candidatus Kapabacteria bacterium]